MKKRHLNKKGFTFVEVIVTISIIGIVSSMIYSLLFFGIDLFNMTTVDYQLQTEVQMAMSRTNDLVQNSRALFAVTSLDYMDDEWSYIGLNEDQTMIVNYKWDPNTQTHISEVLGGPYEDTTFRIVFDSVSSMEKTNEIEMYFETITGAGEVQRYEIDAGFKALNALQVVSYGTESHPAVALAYREENYTYENYNIIVNITMVLDTSGSMGWGLTNQNQSISSSNPSRISVLITQAKMLVELFAQNTNSDVDINISLVPFESYAKNPSSFYDIKNSSEKSSLITKINNLDAEGSTNTGDGLRRAYYKLLEKSSSDAQTANGDTIIKNYTIILVDGDSNTSSMYNTRTCTQYRPNGNCKTWSWSSHYYDGEDTIENCDFTSQSTSCTPGQVSGTNQANAYVGLMGDHLSDDAFVTNYVVSFAKDVSVSQIVYLAESTNTPDSRVFTATDATQLGLSFTNIQMSITNDLWQFLGPKLTEDAG